MLNTPTYSKQVIEIADYIFSNTEKTRGDVVSKFCKEFQKTERTIDSYYKKAKDYNNTRLQKQEKVRDEVLQAETKKSVKSAILTRNESLAILSSIAKGTAWKASEEIMIPTGADRTRAIQQLSKMQGWETDKVDVTTNGKDINQSIQIEIIDKREQINENTDNESIR